MADGMLRIDAAAAEEDALGKSPNDMDLASRKAEEASLRRYDAAGWLRKMVGVLTARDFCGQPSEEDFRLALRSGIILCNALNMIQPGAVPKVAEVPSEEIGIPVFEASDLEQGGKSSRIVNCVLALKSYCEWKEGGGKGVWKFTGTWKPHSASKKFVRKSSGQHANPLSRTSSIVEQNSHDFNEMGTPDDFHLFVRELLSGKKQEDVPLIVGSMLSKVMEQFEQQLARQNEQVGLMIVFNQSFTSAGYCLIVHNAYAHAIAGASSRCVDVPSSDQHQVVEIGTSSSDTDVLSSYGTSEASNNTKGKSWSRNDLRDGNPKRHGSKRHDLVEYYQRSVQELKSTLHSTKEDLHFLHMKYQEEIQYLGKHLNGLAGAASRYQKVLEENRKLYNQVQDLKEALDGQTISIITPAKNGKGKKLFTFNKVFGPSASQDTQPLIRSVLDGYNVCIFAYGQTGSGKTYTMTGPKELTPESLGVNYRALSDLFAISKQRKDSMSYDVSVQMIEIYNEQVRDLLVSDEIRNSSQNGINLPNANIVPVSSISDVIELMNIGLKNRAVGSTPMNDRSRSERADKTGAVGDRLTEAQHINHSLSALGDVIASLAQKQSHVPYRNSKLTQLLKDSLGGQSKTLMFIHISPEPEALGETFSTLKFAERVSTVELGAARANKDSPDVRELKEQIANLKAALFRKESGSINGSVMSSPAPSWQSIGDVSKGEGQTESLAVSRMQSFDGVDFMASPISVVSTEDERSVSGDWVDKVMVKSHLGEDGGHSPDIVYQISRRDTSKAGASDELEYTEVEATDESDYQCQTNGAKQKGGGGTKAKKPAPNQRQMKSPEIRSLIPQPPTRKVGNGSHSPLNKNGKKPATVDGRRKPTSTGGK
ncbi:hypothetical protein SASPL_102695 [Salvia splendens]|uniref:Kinesin motor domain-containing protein n=1 Tax=Salvia splendens TaxID=180675 RepID=A0A8X8YWF5_SALSN|nr:hypothetical protein SASPL_102695 [Salvia splendens]